MADDKQCSRERVRKRAVERGCAGALARQVQRHLRNEKQADGRVARFTLESFPSRLTE